ncbi:MAG: RagB/SusD family nutrient uptake outer membrane protein [Bacteroidales bacterium]
MKTKNLCSIIACFLLGFAACSDNDDSSSEPPKIPASISGHIEKGPFVAGSTVTVSELDKDMNATGKQFSSTISSNDGAFSLNFADGLESNFVEIQVSGYYYNEVSRNLSEGTISLSAIADLDGKDKVNVNLLTHLEKNRVMKLVKSGTSFSDAKKATQKELLSVFNIGEQSSTSESMSIVDGGETSDILLAVSCILQGESSEAELTEQLQWFITDFTDDGKISDSKVSNIIKTNSAVLRYNIAGIKDALQERYASLGTTFDESNFENYIDFDGNGVLHKDEEGSESNLAQSMEEIRKLVKQSYELTQQLAEHTYIFDEFYTNSDSYKNPYFTDDADWQQVIDRNLNSDNKHIEQIWNTAYDIVYNTNNIITAFDNITSDEIVFVSNEPLGVAYALRSYAYLVLTSWFGDVALDLEHYSNPFENPTGVDLPVSSNEEILQAIIDDLEMAASWMYDDEPGNEFVFNKATAQVLLLRSYMAAHDWTNARQIADVCINNGSYSLASQSSDIFVVGSPEIISGFEKSKSSELMASIFDKGDFIPFARLSEVYLLDEEAAMNLGLSASGYKDAIIERGQWDFNSDGLLDHQDFSASVYDVWKKEMSKEGQTFNFQRYQDPQNTRLLPKPKSAMEDNPNLQQNPGY